MTQKVAILGAGSWGTALAVHCARIGHEVALWGRDPALVDRMIVDRVNGSYLPAVALAPSIVPTASLACAVERARLIVAAVPSHGMRTVIREVASALPPACIVISAAKGLEIDSLARMSQVIVEETRAAYPVVVLSGPSFALEVARGLPTAVVAASLDSAAAARVQEGFRGPSLRLYASDDVAGVEFGGALKNIIAIAAGVVEGLGLGSNALAALITRGLVEMSRLACAEGGRRDTLSGLGGLGDLVLTCTGDLSRNRGVGVELGRGRSLADILAGMRMVAEGVRTTRAALALGDQHGVELPIAAEMAAVLDGRRSPLEAVDVLMGRRQRHESEH